MFGWHGETCPALGAKRNGFARAFSLAVPRWFPTHPGIPSCIPRRPVPTRGPPRPPAASCLNSAIRNPQSKHVARWARIWGESARTNQPSHMNPSDPRATRPSERRPRPRRGSAHREKNGDVPYDRNRDTNCPALYRRLSAAIVKKSGRAPQTPERTTVNR